MTSHPSITGINSSSEPPPREALQAWLDRVTHPLRVDRELQLEVRQELRTHLDESFANLRSAGRTEQQARDEAVRALGDEAELSQQLWRANRRRIRMRALAAWVVRLVLPAATVALIVTLSFSAFASYGIGGSMMYRWGLSDWYRDRTFGELPPDVAGLVAAAHARVEERITIARRLAEQFPSDPALYADYATAATRREIAKFIAGPGEGHYASKPIEPLFSETLAILAEGERREPDNAYYPLKSAALLLEASVVQSRDDSALTIQRKGIAGKSERMWSSLKVTDPDGYAQALELFRRAAGKQFLENYSGELLQRKMQALPRPRGLSELSLHAMEATNFPWPDHAAEAIYLIAFAATEEARAGRIEVARDLLTNLRRSIALLMAGMDREVDIRFAWYLERVVDEAEARVALAAGNASAAEAAWAKSDANRLAQHAADTREGGSKGGADVPYPWRGYLSDDADLTPVVRAQSAALTQFGFALLSAAALFVALMYALASLPAWLLSPRDAKPARLFIGWRRLARVIGLGVAAPVVIMLAASRIWSTFSITRDVTPDIGGVFLRYGLLALVVPVLTHVLLRRAIRARAAELGVTLPAAAPLRGRLVILLLAAAATVTAAVLISPAMSVISIENKSARSLAQGVLVAACWIALLGVALRLIVSAHRRGWPANAPFAGTLPRSAFPAAVVAALVVAMMALPLRWWERRAVNDAFASSIVTSDELSGSPYQPLRQKVLEREGVTVRSSN